MLSGNENAMEILLEYPDLIMWENFSMIPSAIDVLKQHVDLIFAPHFAMNSAIFTYDYVRMKEVGKEWKEELQKYFWHPDRVFSYGVDKYNQDFGYN
jgi:hypothetical protein